MNDGRMLIEPPPPSSLAGCVVCEVIGATSGKQALHCTALLPLCCCRVLLGSVTCRAAIVMAVRLWAVSHSSQQQPPPNRASRSVVTVVQSAAVRGIARWVTFGPVDSVALTKAVEWLVCCVVVYGVFASLCVVVWDGGWQLRSIMVCQSRSRALYRSNARRPILSAHRLRLQRAAIPHSLTAEQRIGCPRSCLKMRNIGQRVAAAVTQPLLSPRPLTHPLCNGAVLRSAAGYRNEVAVGH